MEQKVFDNAFFSLSNLQDQLFSFSRATRALKPAEFDQESLQKAVDLAQDDNPEAISSPIFLYSSLLGGVEHIDDYIETIADILQELEIAERGPDA